MTDTKDHDYYERNLGRHPAYSAIMDRLKAEFAELDAAEQAVRLKVDEAEETLASLRSEVPLLEQRYLDAASYQEQHKAKAKLQESLDKLYFVELDLAGLRIGLADAQIATGQEKKRLYDRLVAEKRAELLPLRAEAEALAHAAERNNAQLRHLGAQRGALERKKDELQADRRQELARTRLPAFRTRQPVSPA